VLFFGYGGVLAGAIILLLMPIMGLHKLLRNPRKKSIKDVFDWIWKKSYFNNSDFTAGRYISEEHACGSAIRAVPPEIGDAAGTEDLKAYIIRIRETVDKVLNEEGAKVNSAGVFTNGASITWAAVDALEVGYPEITAETEKESGLKEATGTLKIVKNLSVSKNDKGDAYTLAVSAAELSVHGFMLPTANIGFPLI
jgi:hypothetical protein